MAKILLVEDDNNLREIYEARLQAEGYTIVSAMDGEEALVIAKKEKPDLVISDVMMPRISGFEMLDILRNTEGLKDVKIIMLTALGQAEDKTRADSLGADRYLVKSQVTLEDIVKAAQELLGPNDTAPSAPQATAAAAEQNAAMAAAAAATPSAASTSPPTPTPAIPTASTASISVVAPPPVIPAAPATAPVATADTPTPTPVPDPATAPASSAALPISTPPSEPATPTTSAPAPGVAPPSEPAVPTSSTPAAPIAAAITEPATPAPGQPTTTAAAQAPPVVAPETPEPTPPPAEQPATDTPAPTTEAPLETPVEPPTPPPTPDTPSAPELTTPESSTVTEPAAAEPVAAPVAPEPEPTSASPESSAPATTPAPLAAQSTSAEEAAIKAQIESFVNQNSQTAPKPEGETVMADAIKDLVSDTGKSEPAATQTPRVITPPSQQGSVTPETPKTAESSPDTSHNDSVAVAHKKIIKPITDSSEVQPVGLDELLAKEGITNLDEEGHPLAPGTSPTTNPALPSQPTTTPGLPTTPHPPGHVISPNSSTDGVDPNSISL